MASKIRVLDEQTINQIAAGEVIENPASVVKELVENAMDAGATEICIEIRGGGRQLIRISDNGCGMNRDDALLCLERHATSKIRALDDIHAIYTMGFRGEAVPSIASISKFTIMTCPQSAEDNPTLQDDKRATMVVVDGGKIIQCCPVARSPGTTIEVKSLFFNVPVRKKFQKSPAYDANEILKILSSIALGNPSITFELISDQKTVLSTRVDQALVSQQDLLQQRVKEILGDEFSSSTASIEIAENEYTLQGFIGNPGYTRHNRTGQYLFINKRAVISPLVSFAVRDGFGTSLPQNRHPVYVLHLTMPGELVDVNVHPQKREVRLRQEQSLKEMITRAVRNGMQQSSTAFFDEVDFSSFKPVEELISQSPHMQEMPFQKSRINFDPVFMASLPDEPEEKMCYSSAPMTPVQIKEMPFQESQKVMPELFSEAKQVQNSPRVLSTIKHYILIPSLNGEGLCIIDQRAGHSRVIFDKLLGELQSNTAQMTTQTLLIPHSFQLTPIESAMLLQHLELFNRMGISLRQAGPHAFLVDAIPQVFGNADMRVLITELVQSLSEHGGGRVVQQEHERIFALAANRASISQQKKLSVEEAQSLVDLLFLSKSPFQCPLGKPTLINISFDELAKRFQKG